MVPALRGPFRFDVTRHLYTVGGCVVPGVNGVLRGAGVAKELGFLDEEYRLRGRAVHAATLHYDLTGELAALPERWLPFLLAYVALLKVVRCRWRLSEQARVSRRLGYASTLDRAGEVSGRPAVVEIKTGYEASFHGPQLAGQDLLLHGGGVHSPRRRLGFYLRKDGSYKVVEYRDPVDYAVFTEALTQWWEGEGEHAEDDAVGDDEYF